KMRMKTCKRLRANSVSRIERSRCAGRRSVRVAEAGKTFRVTLSEVLALPTDREIRDGLVQPGLGLSLDRRATFGHGGLIEGSFHGAPWPLLRTATSRPAPFLILRLGEATVRLSRKGS